MRQQDKFYDEAGGYLGLLDLAHFLVVDCIEKRQHLQVRTVSGNTSFASQGRQSSRCSCSAYSGLPSTPRYASWPTRASHTSVSVHRSLWSVSAGSKHT